MLAVLFVAFSSPGLARAEPPEEREDPNPPASLRPLSEATPGGRKFGLGLQLGFPTALSGAMALGGSNVLVAGLGLHTNFFNPQLSLHVDFHHGMSELARAQAFNLNWYLGGGGWLLLSTFSRSPGFFAYIDSNFALLGRGVVGLSMLFREVPAELYAELTPALLVFPGIGLGLGASIGARSWF